MVNTESKIQVLTYLNPFCTEKCIHNINNVKLLNCGCGETGIYNWVWDGNVDESILLSENRRLITFHPVYSAGTAALRGMKPLQKNMHHYWEIKMVSNIYGTDVMIGVGTKDLRIGDGRYRFFSLLGFDEHSWGYSYSGRVQHNGVSRRYGSRFGIGSVIGAHLDMYSGTLEFYYNRMPLGIAFRGLKSHELYPMVCSTAAQSSMRLTCAISLEGGLQLRCLQAIVNNAKLLKKFQSTPGLIEIFEKRYFWLLKRESSGNSARRIFLQYPEYNSQRKLYQPRALHWGIHHDLDEIDTDSSCDMDFSDEDGASTSN